MTALVVDVGNTSTAVGLWSDGRVSHVSHCDGGFAEASQAAARLLPRVSGLASPLASRVSARVSGLASPLASRVSGLASPLASRVSARVSRLASPLASPVSCLSTSLLAYVSVVPAEDAKWRNFAKEHALKLHQVSYRDFLREGQETRDRRQEGGRTRDERRKGGRTRDGRQETRGDGRQETGDATIRIDYPKPATIGADRLADAAGAVTRYGAPVLVMDFGTALTAAVVTRDRVWRGGVIAPGFPLMRDYLFERTAKLPKMKLGSGKAPKIGRSTEEAMRFGALVGYRGMVREIVATLKANFKEDFRLVATGGFARWVLRDLDLDFTIDPDLTLFGAGLVAGTR